MNLSEAVRFCTKSYHDHNERNVAVITNPSWPRGHYLALINDADVIVSDRVHPQNKHLIPFTFVKVVIEDCGKGSVDVNWTASEEEIQATSWDVRLDTQPSHPAVEFQK